MEEHLKQEHTEIIKIAIVGPESTGKTTLASQLAEEFNTKSCKAPHLRQVVPSPHRASGAVSQQDGL